MRPIFLTDFDGTISQDVLTAVFERFSTIDWRIPFKRYRCGEIGSRQLYQDIVPYLNVTEKDMSDFVLENFRLDPYFVKFAAYCLKNDTPLSIASDGLDCYITWLLNKDAVHDIDIFANHAVFSHDRLTVIYPELPSDCPCGRCANCKLDVARNYKRRHPNSHLIYAGDGLSDRYAIQEADLIFAKNELAKYCVEQNIQFLGFNDFSDILYWKASLK
jgi:2,3-diketo-5-methylthio-1-phosphopentane phosphatase